MIKLETTLDSPPLKQSKLIPNLLHFLTNPSDLKMLDTSLPTQCQLTTEQRSTSQARVPVTDEWKV